MNTRILSYNIVADLEFMATWETWYKGHKITRERGKDKHGLMYNTMYTWNGIKLRKVGVIMDLIDKQTKQ